MVTRRREVHWHAIVLSGGAVDLALPVSGTAAGSRMPVADAGLSPATGSQSLSASASGQARFKVVTVSSSESGRRPLQAGASVSCCQGPLATIVRNLRAAMQALLPRHGQH